ncbi:amidohydrolase [Henriciella sp. AS95]|uniref:amidohydrolase n=1 Tax=Henriciella sp. AS95 TaxID=3135782 RepID=UPI003177A8FC
MKWFAAAFLTLALAACDTAGTETEAAAAGQDDTPRQLTVFSGGTIYTGLDDPKTVDSVIVENGRIVGTAPPLSEDWSEDEVTLVDLGGAVMYPGFTDAHAHLIGIGQRELIFSLEGTASIAELVSRVETELKDKAPGEVLFGSGWIETGWPEGRMPSAADLDAVSPDNPVILMRADGHALVANTAALKLADIYDIGGNPQGGRVERGEGMKATGIVIDNSMYPVLQLVPPATEEQEREAYKIGAQVYVSRGWTGMHNMNVDRYGAPIMKSLDEEGLMPLRLYNAYDENADDIARERSYETDTIRNRAMKLFVDGALGSRGALLIEPYSDRPDTSGVEILDLYTLPVLMQKAEKEGVQLAIHAIGDLANRRILDAYEELGYGPDLRWRIEHAQVLASEDIARVGELGLIASMQPSHAIGDLKFAPARLGMDRLGGAYAWKSLIDSGAIVAGGSDAPVEVGSPLIEFYAAVARKDLEGNSGEGWHPEEALSREEALKLFTSNAAYAAFMEDELGTIEAGKLADFTVFDRDLLTVPEAEILDAQPVMTVVQGEIVWRAGD